MALYEDPDFPCNSHLPAIGSVVWRRPEHIVDLPKFFGESLGAHDHFQRRNEIKGHSAGFFLATVAGLTRNRGKFLEICPEQSFAHEYTGKFMFYFYDHGSLRSITIDDRLPTSHFATLIFSDCVGDCFWLPLLEKAYAKFMGGYDKIRTGRLVDAFLHLTGFKPVWIEIPFAPPNIEEFYFWMEDILRSDRLVVCKLNDDNGNNENHGNALTVIGALQKMWISNNGERELRGFVVLRHPNGPIESYQSDQMRLHEVDENGEGVMSIEVFMETVHCIYYHDLLYSERLSYSRGVDAFQCLTTPELEVVNRHRCRKQ